ncbi:MAG: methyltransferase domain-containing protein [Candidatus Zeuxoniibacter abyssi]|nr:MAG: methyltransferase domain-containing protein [Candidatus Persebacteraceae bacterium AB1(2)]
MRKAGKAAIDKRQVCRAFSRFPTDGALAAVTAERLSDILDDMILSPSHVLDVGGGGFAGLQTRYPKARLWAVDLALPILQKSQADIRLCADAERLPIQDGAVDMLWSNLCYEWTDIAKSLPEAARVLKVGGVFIAGILGPDTLREARAAFADDGCPRVHDFTDMHDVGETLLQAGMTEPVVQCERLTFNYATAKDALREVHKQGTGCALADRPRGLMGKARWQKALSHYERRFADDNGRVPATYEVIYAVAWRAATQEKPIHFQRK